MHRRARYPLSLGVVALVAATLCVDAASASTFTPPGTALNLRSTDVTVSAGTLFTADCATSTIAATTTNPASATVTTTPANVTFSGCSATFMGRSCTPTIAVGGGNWSITAPARAVDPPTNSLWAATFDFGTPPATGAWTVPLGGCLAGCTMTATAQAFTNQAPTTVVWSNGTAPTLAVTGLVRFTGVGCGIFSIVVMPLTATYTLTSPTDVNIT